MRQAVRRARQHGGVEASRQRRLQQAGGRRAECRPGHQIRGDMGRYGEICLQQAGGGKAECRPGHQRLAADHVGEGAVEADEEEGD